MYNVFSGVNVERVLFSAGAVYLIYKLACNCANNNRKQGITLRDALSENDIDEIVEESFPASDSPSTY